MATYSSGIYISATAAAVIVVIGIILFFIHLKDKQRREAQDAEQLKIQKEKEEARQNAIKDAEENRRREHEENMLAVSKALKKLGLDNSYESAKKYVDWYEGKDETLDAQYLRFAIFSSKTVSGEDGKEYEEIVDNEDAWLACIRYNQYRLAVLQLLCDAFESHWPDYPYKGGAIRQFEEFIANKIATFPPKYEEIHRLLLEIPRFWLASIREMYEPSPDDPDYEYLKPDQSDIRYPFGIVPKAVDRLTKEEINGDYDNEFMEIARKGKLLSPLVDVLDKKEARFVFKGSEFEAILVGGWFDADSIKDEGKQNFVRMVMEGRGIPSLPGDLLSRACLAADCDLLMVRNMIEPDLEYVGNEYLDSSYEFLSDEAIGLAVKTEKGFIWNIDKMILLLTQVGHMRGIDQEGKAKPEKAKMLWALKVDVLKRIIFSALHSSEIKALMQEAVARLEIGNGPRSSDPDLDLLCMSLMPCDMKDVPLFVDEYIKASCFGAS